MRIVVKMIALGLFCAAASAQTVNFGPVEPLTPSATTLATPSGRVSLAYGSINATGCTAAATSGVTLTPANPLPAQDSLTAAVNNTSTAPVTYTVTVTCNNASSSNQTTATITAPGTITPPPPPTGCAVIKSTTSGITNFTRLTGKVTTIDSRARSIDPTSFVSAFNLAGEVLPWPGNSGLFATINLPINNYVSMQFTVPPSYPTTAVYGDYTYGETQSSAPVAMTISTSCGDFSPQGAAGTTVVAGCYVGRVIPDYFLQWTTQGTCKLTPGSTYFLNYIAAEVQNVTPNGGGSASSTKTSKCLGSACPIPIQNGPGSW
jgi:hypothetical protein